MANSYKNNPIIIDSVSATVDIANLAFGTTYAPVHISRVILMNPTVNDNIILKNRRGAIVVQIDASGVDSPQMPHTFNPPLITDGLQSVSGDSTLTSGKILIYV